MSQSDLELLSRNLRIARTSAGITQAAAAKAVGKSRQTIVNWENPDDTAEPSSAEVATLAALYGLSSRDLRFAALVRPTAAVVAGADEEDEQLATPMPPEATPTARPTRGPSGPATPKVRS